MMILRVIGHFVSKWVKYKNVLDDALQYWIVHRNSEALLSRCLCATSGLLVLYQEPEGHLYL